MSGKKAISTREKKKKSPKNTGKFFRDTRGEFKKISWPSKKQVWNNVLVVLVTVAVFALIVWGLDYILAVLRDLIVGLFDKPAV
jgi:preprotein translocase subunit SecE